MNEQERAFWQAVYMAHVGLGSGSAGEAADAAIVRLRASEAILAVEQRGVPPFATGDKVTLEHGTAEVLHAWWGDTDHVWYVDLMYQGRRLNRITATSLNRVTATSLPMTPKDQP